jgi:peptidoglycan/xylan/chitin deacetylase (PgdA/CDA1 family)
MSAIPATINPVLHLTYHRVVPTSVTYTYALTTEQFREHLKALQSGMPASSLTAKITFDDGNRTQFQSAVPLLAEFEVKATFFVTAGWTGVNKGSMDARELYEISNAGHTVGAHGLSHKLLTHCSDEELRQELSVSKDKLEQAIGKQVSTISMPGGRYNRRVLEACAASGYTEVFTSEPITTVRQECGVRVIGRYNVVHTLSGEGLLRLLDPSSGILRREQRRAAAKRFVQNLMGDDLYLRLWSVVTRAKPSK